MQDLHFDKIVMACRGHVRLPGGIMTDCDTFKKQASLVRNNTQKYDGWSSEIPFKILWMSRGTNIKFKKKLMSKKIHFLKNVKF